MKKDAALTWLTEAIKQATTATSQFQTSGQLPAIDPKLTVNGLGLLKFPLKPAAVKKLKTTSQLAPYGQGTKTLIDPTVRNTLELDPSRFQLGDDWQQMIAEITHKIGNDLGLNGELLEPHIYKLLIYERGGFFLPHRDSEKLDRMVASLIVVLPNPFDGGELNVSHAGESRRFEFSKAKRSTAPEYVAFYADCEHEIKRVTRGLRICLAYNLVLKPQVVPKVKPTTNDPLIQAIQNWIIVKPTEPLIFALDHHYTAKGLSQDLLKGADRPLAEAVLAAAEQTQCVALLTQIERHATYSAYDDSDDYYGRSRRSRKSDGYTIEELIDQEFHGAEWTDPTGEKQPWESLPLDPSAVVCRTPFEDWVPTQEEYEGYTGNAGNTLDRWYHRTALVIWPRAKHYEILATTGSHNTIPMLKSMLSKLKKTPKRQQEQAYLDCAALARGIIKGWPVRWASHASSSLQEYEKRYNDFPDYLLTLGDHELTKLFLKRLNLCDEMTPIDSLVVAACQQHGWDSLSTELQAFFLPKVDTHYAQRSQLMLRDTEWLLALASEPSVDDAKMKLVGSLCDLAVKFYCNNTYEGWKYRRGTGPVMAEQLLPVLLQTLLLMQKTEQISRVIERIRSFPEPFSHQTSQVPALKILVPWCQYQLGEIPPSIANWLGLVRGELIAATKTAPQPPSDWTRPAEVTCKCKNCNRLKTFLADGTVETDRLTAAEYDRDHVLHQISRDQLDVSTTLSKQGRPYTLIMSKTQGSYERAVKQHEQDYQLLQQLPPEPKS